MNRTQNVKFLISLGIPKERAEAMSKTIPDDATATPDADVEAALQSAVDHQNDLYKNGDEYKNALKDKHSQALREVMEKSEKKILSIAGMTKEDVKDLKYDEIVELAFKKASKTGDKSVDDLQAELVKKDNEIKNLNEVVIPTLKGEVETEKTTLKTNAAFLQHIAKLKLREGTDQEDAMILFQQKLAKSGYKPAFNEKGELLIKNQDDSEVLSEDKRSKLKTEDIFNKFLDGQIEKSAAPEGDKKKEIIDVDKDKKNKPANGSVVNANIEKSKKHAQMLKEQASKTA
jgi:hypothetical protein